MLLVNKKLFGPMTGQNRARRKTKLNAGRKKAEFVRCYVATRGEKHEQSAGTLQVDHEPCG